MKIIDIARTIIYFPKKINTSSDVSLIFLQGNKDTVDSKTYLLIFKNMINLLCYSDTFNDLFRNNSPHFLVNDFFYYNNINKKEFNQKYIDEEIAFILYIFLHYYVFFASVLEGNSRMLMKDFSALNFIATKKSSDFYSIQKIKSIETTPEEDEFEKNFTKNMLDLVDLFDSIAYTEGKHIQTFIQKAEENILPLYRYYILKKENRVITPSSISDSDLFKSINNTSSKINKESLICFTKMKSIPSEKRKKLISSILKELLLPLPEENLYKEAEENLKNAGLLNLTEEQQNKILMFFEKNQRNQYRSYLSIYNTYHSFHNEHE